MSTNNADTNAESKAKMIALFGGADLAVLYEDGTAETVRVRQLRIGEYEKACPLMQDEFAITAFCTSLSATPAVPCNREWILKLAPLSYESLCAKVQEVNGQGFFAFSARKQAAQEAENLRWIKQAAELPAEVLAAAIKRGQSILRTSSRPPRVIPG
jgi:hypothetical protein